VLQLAATTPRALASADPLQASAERLSELSLGGGGEAPWSSCACQQDSILCLQQLIQQRPDLRISGAPQRLHHAADAPA
jgi:hypothetical protein